MVTPQEGTKADQGKPRLDLIPPEILFSLGDILEVGAKKYSEHNWAKGMAWGRVYGALQRHLWAWWSRQDTDPETGRSHLSHALACLSFLIAYEQRNVGTDDRYKT